MRKLKLYLALLLAITLMPMFTHKAHAETICPHCGSSNVSVVNYIANPSCTGEGDGLWSCNDCQRDFGAVIPPLGHDYVANVISAPTCNESGTQKMTCLRCQDEYIDTIPAVGHRYVLASEKDPTCTTEGSEVYRCRECGFESENIISALGHSYKTSVTKKATCTESGKQVTECSRCGASSVKTLDVLGHDYKKKTEKLPTCTEEGLDVEICSRCGDRIETAIPALGHSIRETESKDPTCTEEGYKSGICETCKEETKSPIAALGHDYAKEWTTEKEAGFFEEGLRVKTCSRCGDRMEEAISRKTMGIIGGSGSSSATGSSGGAGTSMIIAIVAGVAAAGGLIWYALSRKAAKAAAKKIFVTPKLGPKKIFLYLKKNEKSDEFIELLKSKIYLKVKLSDGENLPGDIKGEEPSLIVIEVADENDKKEYEQLKERIREVNSNVPIRVISDLEMDDCEALSPSLKNAVLLVRLVLPLYKPNLKEDNSVEYLGEVGAALGFPGVKVITGLFLAGKDIKLNLDKEDNDASDAANIIEDIAYILGFEKVEKIANLVDATIKVKEAFDEGKGNHEKYKGVKAGKKIVDSVKEVL